MKKLKFLLFSLLGAVAFLFASAIFKRVIAISLCGILGANSPACYVLGQGKVMAQTPDLIADIFDNPNPNPNSGNNNQNNQQNTGIFDNPNPNGNNNQNNQQNTLQDIISPPSNSSVQYIRNEFQSPIFTYYVNGIRTDNTGYSDNVGLISSRLLNGIVDPPRIDVPTHNPTGTILLTDNLITRILKNGIGDLWESLRQMLDAPRPDSEIITNTIIEAIKKRDKEKKDKAKQLCEDKKRAKFLI